MLSTEMKSVITRSGFTQGEVASIFGVSRVMVNRYLNKGVKPVANNKVRVERAVNLLRDLVRQGKLPLPYGVAKDRRTNAVNKIKQYLDKSA